MLFPIEIFFTGAVIGDARIADTLVDLPSNTFDYYAAAISEVL